MGVSIGEWVGIDVVASVGSIVGLTVGLKVG